VHAVVTTARGVFSGLGDASPANVPAHIRAHLIRMAETRSKARALRDAVNVAVASIEELGGDDDDAPAATDTLGVCPQHGTPWLRGPKGGVGHLTGDGAACFRR